MSHEIGMIDRQEGTRQAWHGLTVVRSVIKLAESWLAQWNVEKRAMIEPDGSQSEYCRIVCTDDPSIKIGKPVHCETYGLIDNREFLAICQDSIDNIAGATVESVGSVCDRARVFVSVKVPDCKELSAAGRKFEPYLNFLSSHDMSAPFLVNASTICTVCNNTFGLNLHDTENKVFRVRVPHTKNAKKSLANISGLIDAYVGTQARFAAILNGLESQPVSSQDAERFFTGLLTVKDDRDAVKFLNARPAKDALELSTRRTNQIERLVDLFRNGAGNDGNGLDDIFQAATDYYSHESSGGDNVMRQVASSDYGAGAVMKSRVFETLQSEQETKRLIDVGGLVLAAN